MHSNRQLAHLDLKPDNIVFTASFLLSLIDFAMSELLGLVVKAADRPDKMTPIHRAPEVWSNDSFEAAPVDVWGVGVVLYTILFLRYPFGDNQGCSSEAKYTEFISGFTSWIENNPSEIPFGAILSCFQRDPESRPTMETLAAMPYFQKTSLKPEEEQEIRYIMSLF